MPASDTTATRDERIDWLRGCIAETKAAALAENARHKAAVDAEDDRHANDVDSLISRHQRRLRTLALEAETFEEALIAMGAGATTDTPTPEPARGPA